MKNKKRELEFPVALRHKNIVFNKSKQAWAFYRLNSKSLKLNSETDYLNYVDTSMEFLNNDEVQYHIMLIPKRFDFTKYTGAVKKDVVRGEFAEIGRRYFDRAADILTEEIHLYEYDIYVGVHLNRSDTVTTNDVNDLLRKFFKRLQDDISKVMLQTTNVDDDLETFEKKERSFYERVSYQKQIHRVEEEELDRLIYYMFHRTSDKFEIPDGEYNLTEGIIKNKQGYMTVDHGEYKEYLCFLPFHEMPASIEHYKYIQNVYDNIDFPLEMQIRYDFKQQDQNTKTVRKLKKRFDNFDREIASAHQADDDSIVENASERLEKLLEDVKKNNRKILYMTFTLVISDRSKDVLENKYEALKNIFRPTDFKLVRPLVDQLTLFSQALPASELKYRYFEHPVDESYLAQGGLELNNKIGNRYGMYLGKVITGRKLNEVSDAKEINNNVVMFNPLLTKKALKGAAHTNGNISITGPPGSGKSMLVKNFFTWSTFFGTKVLYIDPKNEYQRYFQTALDNHPDNEDFKEMYDRINFIHLSEEKAFKGALDPLVFLDGDKAVQTAIMIFNTLAGRERKRDENVSIHDAIVEELEHSKKPTLTGALQRLEQKQSTLAKDIRRYQYGLGRMLFGDENSKGLNFDQQVNVLGMQGLDLPETEEMTDEQTISLCLMMSISKYVNTFSRKPEEEAMIIFDESWALSKSKHGESLINEMLRTGRSLRTDIVLVTQAYDDVDSETIKEQIGVKFAFRPRSEDSLEPTLKYFDMEVNDENKEVVKALKSGMCLFQDHLGRTQAIAHDILFDEWVQAFVTTKTGSEDVALEEAQ